jgi:hypothetical protein
MSRFKRGVVYCLLNDEMPSPANRWLFAGRDQVCLSGPWCASGFVFTNCSDHFQGDKMIPSRAYLCEGDAAMEMVPIGLSSKVVRMRALIDSLSGQRLSAVGYMNIERTTPSHALVGSRQELNAALRRKGVSRIVFTSTPELESLTHLQRNSQVKTINYAGILSKGQLYEIARNSHLTGVSIHRSVFDEEACQILSRMTSLVHLDLSWGELSDGIAGVIDVNRRLKSVCLANSSAGDRVFHSIARLPECERASIAFTKVDAVRNADVKWRSRVRSLDVSGIGFGTGTILKLIDINRTVELGLCYTEITDDMLRVCAGMTQLTRLSLLGTRVTMRGVGRFLKCHNVARVSY